MFICFLYYKRSCCHVVPARTQIRWSLTPTHGWWIILWGCTIEGPAKTLDLWYQGAECATTVCGLVRRGCNCFAFRLKLKSLSKSEFSWIFHHLNATNDIKARTENCNLNVGATNPMIRLPGCWCKAFGWERLTGRTRQHPKKDQCFGMKEGGRARHLRHCVDAPFDLNCSN